MTNVEDTHCLMLPAVLLATFVFVTVLTCYRVNRKKPIHGSGMIPLIVLSASSANAQSARACEAIAGITYFVCGVCLLSLLVLIALRLKRKRLILSLVAFSAVPYAEAGGIEEELHEADVPYIAYALAAIVIIGYFAQELEWITFKPRREMAYINSLSEAERKSAQTYWYTRFSNNNFEKNRERGLYYEFLAVWKYEQRGNRGLTSNTKPVMTSAQHTLQTVKIFEKQSTEPALVEPQEDKSRSSLAIFVKSTTARGFTKVFFYSAQIPFPLIDQMQACARYRYIYTDSQEVADYCRTYVGVTVIYIPLIEEGKTSAGSLSQSINIHPIIVNAVMNLASKAGAAILSWPGLSIVAKTVKSFKFKRLEHNDFQSTVDEPPPDETEPLEQLEEEEDPPEIPTLRKLPERRWSASHTNLPRPKKGICVKKPKPRAKRSLSFDSLNKMSSRMQGLDTGNINRIPNAANQPLVDLYNNESQGSPDTGGGQINTEPSPNDNMHIKPKRVKGKEALNI